VPPRGWPVGALAPPWHAPAPRPALEKQVVPVCVAATGGPERSGVRHWRCPSAAAQPRVRPTATHSTPCRVPHWHHFLAGANPPHAHRARLLHLLHVSPRYGVPLALEWCGMGCTAGLVAAWGRGGCRSASGQVAMGVFEMGRYGKGGGAGCCGRLARPWPVATPTGPFWGQGLGVWGARSSVVGPAI
jgi:hypothetical protein